jgi:hypothetical protein
MKNLKRFRRWIAFVAAACRSYLQQLSTRKAAEVRPHNATSQSSGSASAVTEQRTEQLAKPVTAPTPGSRPNTTTASSNASVPKSKPIPAPVKPPVVQVTAEVSVASGEAHQSAQRLARVLISEIKLYYMSKIESQNQVELKNIYDLLKGPIDKSRQHYNQRVGADASSMPDYFHGELVKTLCAGDESRLGPNYTALSNRVPN